MRGANGLRLNLHDISGMVYSAARKRLLGGPREQEKTEPIDNEVSVT
jgi:hypothetical protein